MTKQHPAIKAVWFEVAPQQRCQHRDPKTGTQCPFVRTDDSFCGEHRRQAEARVEAWRKAPKVSAD